MAHLSSFRLEWTYSAIRATRREVNRFAEKIDKKFKEWREGGEGELLHLSAGRKKKNIQKWGIRVIRQTDHG